MAYLEGLLYRSGEKNQMQLPETRQGLPVYSGGPAHLSEYLFKVGLKSKAIASIEGEGKGIPAC